VEPKRPAKGKRLALEVAELGAGTGGDPHALAEDAGVLVQGNGGGRGAGLGDLNHRREQCLVDQKSEILGPDRRHFLGGAYDLAASRR
jgi:hypothetical protein